MRRLTVSLGSLSLAMIFTLLSIPTAQGAGILLLRDFQLHGFDETILDILGYDAGSVVYWREIGSINEEEKRGRIAYENIGCHPFYVMKGGKVEDNGYNCRTFFCVGYTKGPKQCRTNDGKVFGGVVEINRRLESIKLLPKKVYFKDLLPEQHSERTRERLSRLEAIRCKPYYLVEFKNVAVAEGYECEEVGDYPFFSSENNCLDDWNVEGAYVCDVPIRVNEYDIRLRAISYREGGTRSVPPSSSRFSSLAGEWGSSTPVQFSDLSPTHPAYNAIRNLAQQGILQGYRDGTFKPGATVTRAELIKILVAGLHPKELQKEGRCFKDVRDDWFAPFVCAAKRLAWVGGYTDGSFKPGNPVTRAEALKMIVASMPDFHTTSSIALPRDVRPEAWFAPFVQKAIRLGILRQGSFRPTVNLTRADAALWIHAAMQPTPQQEEVQEESALSEDAAGSNQSQGSPHS